MKFLARDYSLANSAHLSSSKSVLDWSLLAEQIVICHYNQQILVPSEKKTTTLPNPHQANFSSFLLCTNCNECLLLLTCLYKTDVLSKALALHFIITSMYLQNTQLFLAMFLHD